MRVLGLSAFYHDSAAALVEDGRIVAAAQEERFTRKKFDAGYPRLAIDYCLSAGNIKLKDVDRVVFYDKPFIKFERLLETYLTYSPRGFTSFRMALPLWLREKLFQKSLLTDELKAVEPDFDWADRLTFCEHHLSHAASAFYPSPFDKAAVLTLDGVGEWTTTAVAVGNGKDLEIHKEIHFPHSLGLLYSAFTYYTGFKVNSGEYKLMGLAPYGTPKYEKVIRDNLIDLKPDGSFRLNLDYFNYCTGLTMTNERFHALFGAPPRNPETWLEQKHMDIAASIQAVLEDVVLRLTRSLAAETGMENLCLAGGVALNCVANGKVLREGRFRNIWIQPAAGDAGGALGAALAAYHIHEGHERTLPNSIDGMAGAYLGPEFDQPDIDKTSDGCRCAIYDRGSRRHARHDRQGAGGRPSRGLVPGPHGVRAARARQSLDPRRPAQPEHAEEPQPQGQVPRELPAVCPIGPARAGCRMVRPRRRQPLHAARRSGGRTAHAAHDAGGRGVVRDRQAQRCALDHSCGHARRLFGAGADGASRDQPGLSRSHQPLPWLDRLPGGDQHQLQRAQRADRLHARGRVPMFHGNRARPAGRRKFGSSKGRPGSDTQNRLQGQV